ncbi:hypothetical protein [Sphingobium sp. YR657]
MRRFLPLPALLMLGMCATVQPYANCDTARMAARLATAAMARICPITLP